MDRSYFTILMLAVSLSAFSCGESNAHRSEASPTPESVKTSPVTVPQPNSDNNTAAGASPRPGTGLQANSGVRPVINADPNVRVSNTGPVNESLVTSESNKGINRNVMRRRERVDVDPSATPPPPTFQPAPENSEFAVQMEKGGNIVETRVFKSHPQLKRVEIRWTGPQSRSLKVTLKSGKIVERQSVPAVNLRTVSSAELLDLAGIKAGQR
mgnify:CR=1 FL=1